MNDIPTISFFIPALNIGGVERVLVLYANSLSNNYNIEFVTCRPIGDFISLLSERVVILNLGNIRSRSSIIPLRKYLKEKKPRILITGPDISNVIGIIAAFRIKTTKIIISQHNSFDVEMKKKGPFKMFGLVLIKLLYPFADHVISVSQNITSFLLSIGISEKKITTLYNPVDFDSINVQANMPNELILPQNFIVFVGGLRFIKNVPLLVRAFSLINYPELNLVIVGDGPEKQELENLIKETPFSERIHLIGNSKNPFSIIKNAKVLILPSFSESFSLTIVEALALGKTVVYTPTAGPNEILEGGKFGFLCNSFTDINEMAKIIEFALNHPIDSVGLIERAKDFDIKSNYQYLDKLIKRFLN